MDMLADEINWVLGHRIRSWSTDPSYGLIEVTSPPKVPGPPPHFHKRESEFFLILHGELDVMEEGRWRRAGPGSFLEMPPGTTHTFINNTASDVVWVTGWRPKGFEQFFRHFGVPVAESGSRERSVSPEMIQRVIAGCQAFGMYVKGA